MKPHSVLLCAVFSAFLLCFITAAQGISQVPDGNYLLTVELNGQQQRLNLKIQGGRAKCIKTTDSTLAMVEGQFQKPDPKLQAPANSFIARFRNGLGSQLWIARPDGSFAVREVPDRGEQQSAVPMKGDSLEAPKTK
ncbi:MAG TPA: hypothetical protein VMZ30_02725 [Pyrinomonadaceae bacterium]|nr:hypothetical protein [Pyrinomonadaceae bacterium]